MNEITLPELAFFVAVASLIVKGMTMAVDYAASKTKAGRSKEDENHMRSQYEHQETQRTQTDILNQIKSMGERQDRVIELTREQMAAQKSQYDAINHKLDLMDKTLAKKEDVVEALRQTN